MGNDCCVWYRRDCFFIFRFSRQASRTRETTTTTKSPLKLLQGVEGGRGDARFDPRASASSSRRAWQSSWPLFPSRIPGMGIRVSTISITRIPGMGITIASVLCVPVVSVVFIVVLLIFTLNVTTKSIVGPGCPYCWGCVGEESYHAYCRLLMSTLTIYHNVLPWSLLSVVPRLRWWNILVCWSQPWPLLSVVLRCWWTIWCTWYEVMHAL